MSRTGGRADMGEVADGCAVATRLAHVMAAAAVAGGLTGLLVGGVLGRLAMRLLAATSPVSAQGGITDDGAVVGVVSLSGSVALALFCLQVGALIGLVLLLARRVLPSTPARRAAGSAVLAATVGGALFVHGNGSFDFTALGPAWLAVALFVALPLLYGLATPLLTDAVAARTGWWLVPLGVLVLVQPPSMAVAVLAFGVAVLIATVEPLARFWQGRAVTVAGTALLVLLVGWGAYDLAADVLSL